VTSAVVGGGVREFAIVAEHHVALHAEVGGECFGAGFAGEGSVVELHLVPANTLVEFVGLIVLGVMHFVCVAREHNAAGIL